MQLSAVDQSFWFAGFSEQIALSAVLIYRRQYQTFPIFLLFILNNLAFAAPLFWLSAHASPIRYEHAYIVTQIIDFMLQLGVLVEIAYRVLQPDKKAMPRALRIAMFSILVVAFAITIVWAFRHGSNQGALEQTFAKLVKVSFLFSFLRLIVFALIAGFSQMLGVTWRNHVIRLAGGLAFYSAVSVVVQLTISHLSLSDEKTYIHDYYLLFHTQTVGYLLALAFWVWSFVQKDAPRREFTPQMERFLVTISQTARRSRVGFARSMGHK